MDGRTAVTADPYDSEEDRKSTIMSPALNKISSPNNNITTTPSSSSPSSRHSTTSSSSSESSPPSSNAAAVAATTSLIAWNSKPLFGPQRSLPTHIIDILDNWHRANQQKKKYPQFAYQNNRNSRASKTFDRQGNELELSALKVIKPLSYFIMVLYPASGPEKLVTCFAHRSSTKTYLVGWDHAKQDIEAECCAVRMFGIRFDEIKYDSQVWKALDERMQQVQQKSTPQSPTQTAKRQLRNSQKSRPLYLQNPSPEEDSSDSQEEEAESEVEQVRVVKKPRTNGAQPRGGRACEVFFQLVYYRIDGRNMTCCFPLEACRSVGDLFQRAQTFFPSSFKDINGKVLRCETPGKPPLDIFEACSWEFTRLVEQAQSLRDRKEPLYIVVKPKLM